MCMPFGLKQATGLYQYTIPLAMRAIALHKAISYLGHSQTSTQRLQNILKLSPHNCLLFQKTLADLRNQITGQGVKIKEDDLQQIMDWPIPKTLSQVKHIL